MWKDLRSRWNNVNDNIYGRVKRPANILRVEMLDAAVALGRLCQFFFFFFAHTFSHRRLTRCRHQNAINWPKQSIRCPLLVSFHIIFFVRWMRFFLCSFKRNRIEMGTRVPKHNASNYRQRQPFFLLTIIFAISPMGCGVCLLFAHDGWPYFCVRCASVWVCDTCTRTWYIVGVFPFLFFFFFALHRRQFVHRF